MNTIYKSHRLPFFCKPENSFLVTTPVFLRSDSKFQTKLIGDRWHEDEIKAARSLSISLPTEEDKYEGLESLISSINKMPNLNSLLSPADLINCFSKEILKRLEYLSIASPSKQIVFDTILNSKEFFLPDQTLQSLKSFDFFLPIKYIKNFSKNTMPNLTWCGLELEALDRAGTSFKKFEEFDNFFGFEVRSIKNEDLLDKIKKDISALYLWSITARQFKFEKLEEFKSLKYIWLNGFSGNFDFKDLSLLKNLEEITITSYSGFKNIEVLSDLRNLKSLTLSSVSGDLKIKLTEILSPKVTEIELRT